MAAINDLINQIQDPALRERIQKEVNKLAKQKKFGLVFEEHMPECTPLYDMPIKVGTTVAKRAGSVNDIYTVLSIKDGVAACVHKESQETCTIDVADLVAVAEFGESIYPYLKPIDAVCNAPSSDLWHTLIEADNYHALQLLEYLYAGKVDCIYIDPPYNSGARDWKYNNDYVDSNDTYRHSKWLSFMQKRLLLAKRLLNPHDAVLIVTIDEKEYLHLGCLLEEVFNDARIQMVSSVINPKGQSRNGLFARTDEYIFYVMIGNASVQSLALDPQWRSGKSTTTNEIRWQYLRRPGKTGQVFRHNSPGCFYPIFVRDDLTLHSIGEALPLGVSRDTVIAPEGTTAIWPMCADGREGCYQVSPDNLRKLYSEGFLHITEVSTSGIHYLKSGEREKVYNGVYKVIGHRENDGSVIVESGSEARFVPGTQWNIPTHNAGDYGKKIINNILADARFTYPKSLYAVVDCLRFVLSHKPNALVVDFFAGSGTTLHAVNLLNAEDGGNRRCIMVTNNEISAEERKEFEECGIKPGDSEWENRGIARYVTWPRTVCSIKGHDINGESLKGNYIGSDAPMSDGFMTNAVFFQLSFLEKTAVALGMTFKELIPTLWMKAGAIGKCPTVEGCSTPHMLILPENKFAVLVNENAFSDFEEELATHPEIQTVFLATDYDINYRAMVKNLNVQTTYQLYRDYLDHFRLNRGRS